MDKYEYKVRLEEINKLIDCENYIEAASLADTIDWRRVKSISTLLKIAALYRVNRRNDDARAVMIIAYDKYPTNRSVLYSLCEISIETDDIVAAIEYYKQFVRIAPRDNGVFTLRYRILEAQEASLEERIQLLEELKKRYYQEEWGYELAYLYHRVGLVTQCVEECNQMVIWFSDGPYVKKALELKMLHESLTPEQQRIYDEEIRKAEAGAVGDYDYNEQQDYYSDETDYYNNDTTAETTNYSNSEQGYYNEEGYNEQGYYNEEGYNEQGYYNEEGYNEQGYYNEEGYSEQGYYNEEGYSEQGYYEQEQPVEEELQQEEVKNITVSSDMSQYNTINLQKVVAESMKEIFADEKKFAEERAQFIAEEQKFSDSLANSENDESATRVVKSSVKVTDMIAGVSQEEPKPQDGAIKTVFVPGNDARVIKEDNELSQLRDTTEITVNEEQLLMEEREENVYKEPVYEVPVLNQEDEAEYKEEIADELAVSDEEYYVEEAEGEEYTNEEYYAEEAEGEEYTNEEYYAEEAEGEEYTNEEYYAEEAEGEEYTNEEYYAEEAEGEEYTDEEYYAEEVEGEEYTDEEYYAEEAEGEEYTNEEYYTEETEGEEYTNEEYYAEEAEDEEYINEEYYAEETEGEEYINEEYYVEETQNEETAVTENIGSALSEWERIKQENAKRHEAELRQRILSQTGQILANFDTSVQQSEILGGLEVDDDIEKIDLAKEEMSQIKDDFLNAEETAEMPVEEIQNLEQEEEAFAEEGYSEIEMAVRAEMGGDTVDIPHEQINQVIESEITEADEVEELAEIQDIEDSQEYYGDEDYQYADEITGSDIDEYETPNDGMLNTKEIVMNTADISMLQEKIIETTDKEAKGALREEIREFTDKEHKLFDNFAVTKRIKKQTIFAIDNMTLASYTGNVVITGEPGMDTVQMAKNLVRAYQQFDDNFSGKVAKTTGKKLNNREIRETLESLNNGALIIEKANGIKEEKLYELAVTLNQENLGIIIIIEDTKKEITKLFHKQAMISDYFNLRIDLVEMDTNSLVEYAKNYAFTNEYSIDELGILALYSRISNMQSGNHVVTKAEVKEIIDEAIWRSKRNKVRSFVDILFSKRYDSEDMIILKERDFM